jgi:hypothetical protein
MKAICTSIEKHESGKSTATFEADEIRETVTKDEKTGKPTVTHEAERKVLAVFHLSAVETERDEYKEGEEYELAGYSF